MLLCIEMAIFAVMHLFAFPWRDYDISSPTYKDPLLAPGSGYSGAKPEYVGGKFGLKAWLDAFNPWDIIKATARGTRWLFVGRKHRHRDVSYANAGAAPAVTDIPGPHVTSAPPPAAGTELQGRGRADTYNQTYDDRAGLLSHVQQPAVSPGLGRQNSDEEADVGFGTAPHASFAQPGGHYAGSATARMPSPGLQRWDTDTEYHADPSALSNSALHAQQGYPPHGQVPPQQGQNQWNHWAGAGNRG